MNSQPPPPSSQSPPPLADPMEFPHTFNELELSSVWDFDGIFDFTYDGQLNQLDELNPSWSTQSPPLPLDSTAAPAVDSLAGTSDHGSETASEKIRKRDPRLTCENFLAGRIPCACPELDEMVEEALEEESGRAGKKKPRTAKAVGIVRCQVPACEADISELKGYHKRHRVCLRCVNANEVLLDGEPKRYCQQCGKFHILPDFDEGKRSCRRKLEWHNKRRRRKLTNVRGVTGKKSQADQPAEDTASDDKAGKDVSFLSNPSFDDTVESEDGRVSPHDSHPSSQNVQSDSVISFVTSGEGQTNGEKKSSKCTPSSSFGDNKNSYSSMCPTGRISFKLYDWNPAEFPRRLRHQIFQWLGSMPVELEGYIRPGCTILTVFMAMPWFMWDTLSGDASSFIQDFISAPESLLFGRGPMIVYLNDLVFRVLKGQTSLMNVKVELRAPRLHYVQPTCFEAGQPIEFVVCGSDLIQPKFRFLVSFAGRYLEYDYCLAIPQKRTGMHSGTEEERIKSCEHQMYKICIPNTDPELFGPAFVEVENESGISNFIPVLIGDRHLCSEMQIVQQGFYKSNCSNGFKYGAHDILSQMCEGLVLRRAAMSELLLDVAWLLKERQLDDIQTFFTSMQIQRFNYLLKFLIQNESTVVLEKILHTLRSFTDVGRLNKLDNETNNSDLKLFLEYLEHAREIVQQRYKDVREQVLHSESSLAKEDLSSHNHGESEMLCVSCTNEDKETVKQDMLGSTTSNFQQSEATPLINNEVIMNVNHRPPLTKNWQQNTSGHIFSSKIIGSRPFVFVVATAVVCFGACVVVLHPNKVGDFAISIRRSLFGNLNS